VIHCIVLFFQFVSFQSAVLENTAQVFHTSQRGEHEVINPGKGEDPYGGRSPVGCCNGAPHPTPGPAAGVQGALTAPRSDAPFKAKSRQARGTKHRQ